MKRTVSIWIVSVLVAGAAVVYQRVTGPTYPVRGSTIIGAVEVAFKLPRSHGGEGDAEVKLAAADQQLAGFIEYVRYPSEDDWTRRPLQRDGDTLVGRIPHQPQAGKVMYRVFLGTPGVELVALTAEPIRIRFRGDVPVYVLVPHVLGMVLAMVWAVRAALEALLKRRRVFELSLYTISFVAVGGIILGAIVQKCAFGEYWTGWPFGHDLTDNKTALALLVWILAAWRVRKNPGARGWVIIAALVMFAVWLIPHSVWGSELDYAATTGPAAP
jgi:hypothetical protein